MFDIKEYETKMNGVIEHLENELSKIRTGRANPKMLDGVMVEMYGNPTPIAHAATISVPDAQQLMIKPFDPSQLDAIERGINEANLGINPTNDGENIRINVPALTEETRKGLAKDVKAVGEEHKVRIRTIRQDANNFVKKSDDFSDDEKKGYENDIQDLTNNFNKKIDEVVKKKEEDVMTI
jgi:ribosome recycling factor